MYRSGEQTQQQSGREGKTRFNYDITTAIRRSGGRRCEKQAESALNAERH
jgi:hypothetical protein